MIDLHCHYLPGIDDGAQTLEESLELARAAVTAGIRVAVMTPHVHPGRYENTASSIKKLCDAFQHVLKDNDIPLKVQPGGEVRISEDIIPMVEQDEIPYIGEMDGYRVMLLEFPHSHLTIGSEKLVRWLLDRRIRPLVAHPERNKEVMRKPAEKLRPFIEMGCLLQLTGGSITGRFGKAAQNCATEILAHEWAAAVASDAHNLQHRPPCLNEAYHALVAMAGESFARDLTMNMPAKIIGAKERALP